MDGPKLEWMYRDSNEVVDREEYLLGRPIDKAFEQSSFSNEIEKDCLPTPIFANTTSNVQVDVVRKLKEDPLEIIRQQEIERRKQLLKNPVKLKKLQNMLKTKENDAYLKKSNEKKKKSDYDSSDIDKLLASKYMKIMKKHGIKSLSELSDINVKKKLKSSKKRRKSGSDDSSSSSSASDSDEVDSRQHKEDSRKKQNHKSSEPSRHHNKKHKDSYKQENSYRERQSNKDINGRNKDVIDKKFISRNTSEKVISDKNRRPDKEKDPARYSDKRDISLRHRPRSDNTHNPSKKNKNNSLSGAEKQKRLDEMMQNAKWRDDVRSQNIARYKKEESSEKVENYSEDFLRKQMRHMIMATSNKSVESRIKSNINNIQKSKLTMNENFIKR